MVYGEEISLWFVPDLEERLRALFFFLCTMSRCFPFPPPGYEKKKLSPDDAHTLLKEKPKEKKEKKDRKERSEEKRREKKEKKRKDKKDKKEKDKKRSDSEKVLETSEHQNGIQSTQSEPQFLVELEKRFKHDDGATQSKTIATNNGSEKFKENHIEAKEKFMDKRMVNGQTLTVEVKNDIFPVEKIDEKPKEKKKHRRSSDGGIGETREDKKRKKEKKKEEKSKEQINHTLDIHGSNDGGNGNHGKRKFTQSNGVLHDKDNLLAPKFPRSISMEMENGSKYNSSQVITVHNAQVNGTKLEQKITLNNHKVHTGILLTQPVQGPKRLLESSETPNKLTTNLELEVSSSLLVVKNGLKSDIQTALDLDKTVKHVNDSLKKTEETKQSKLKVGTSSQPNIQTNMVDNKTHMVNGVIKKHKSKKVKEKPPHPDLKYLNEILTVSPQLEWSEFDDQEWLFSNNGMSKSTKVEEETKQVWSEALLLESGDIIALPYVIPY